MGIFEGKTPAERNKMIAAIVLSVLATISLIYTFGPGLLWSSGKTNTAANTSTSPSPTAGITAPNVQPNQDPNFPTRDEIYSEYQSIPIAYNPNSFFAPPPGRNIFAFYEPPPPTPVPSYTPVEKTPTPIPEPTPTPRPPLELAFITPRNVYEGTNAFRLEANGDKFTPETRVYFNSVPLPTTFVSPQKVYAQIPASYIANAGQARINAATPDGRLYSREDTFIIQERPKPKLQYIGLIARRHNNNDTAFFMEEGKRTGDPIEARLNDVIGGRFRVTSISVEEVKLEDTRLGFTHTLKLFRPPPGARNFTQPTPRPTRGRPIRRSRSN
jgi:hypothetical protein